MTCIVGLIDENKKIYIGGDSATTADTARTIIRTPKVFTLKRKFNNQWFKIAMGCCGSLRMSQLLKYELKIPNPKNISPYRYMVTEMVPAMVDCLKSTCTQSDDSGLQWPVGSMVIVGFNNRLFSIWWDFNVEERAESFNAIGSGAPYAMGFLYGLWNCEEVIYKNPKMVVKSALQCAADLDSGCSGPFNIVSV